jgi:hypothetical protein
MPVFVSGAALAPALLSEDRTDRSHFWMDVQGAHRATATGRVAYGPVGRPGEAGASFTSRWAPRTRRVPWSSPGSTAPCPTRAAPRLRTRTRWIASAGGTRCILAGSATKPEGVFHADAGMMEITSATEGRISGAFRADRQRVPRGFARGRVPACDGAWLVRQPAPAVKHFHPARRRLAMPPGNSFRTDDTESSQVQELSVSLW